MDHYYDISFVEMVFITVKGLVENIVLSMKVPFRRGRNSRIGTWKTVRGVVKCRVRIKGSITIVTATLRRNSGDNMNIPCGFKHGTFCENLNGSVTENCGEKMNIFCGFFYDICKGLFNCGVMGTFPAFFERTPPMGSTAGSWGGRGGEGMKVRFCLGVGIRL